MKSLPRLALLFLVVTASVGCDQATKHLANASLRGGPDRSYCGDTLRLTWQTNDGAFLSLGSSLPADARYWILTVAVGGLLVALVGYALCGRRLSGYQVIAYGLIAGGGASNWFDRARYDGRVVDFLNVGLGTLRTGIFNLADVAIMTGITLLLLARGRPGASRAS